MCAGCVSRCVSSNTFLMQMFSRLSRADLLSHPDLPSGQGDIPPGTKTGKTARGQEAEDSIFTSKESGG